MRMAERAAVLGVALSIGTTGVAAAEIVSHELFNLGLHARVRVVGPRQDQTAPVALEVRTKFKTLLSDEPVPALTRVGLELDRSLAVSTTVLPFCKAKTIRESSVRRVQARCGNAEVGHGLMTFTVGFPGQGNFVAIEDLTGYNGRYKGRPAIIALVTRPETGGGAPLIFPIGKKRDRTTLNAVVPTSASSPPKVVEAAQGFPSWITGFSLTLKRLYRVDGKVHSLVSARCKTPSGVVSIGTTFGFLDGTEASAALNSECEPPQHAEARLLRR